MPTYNRPTLLTQAAESVLRQTTRDLELIIVDDASDDDTPEVCQRMQSVDPRIKVIRRQRNSREICPEEEPRNDGLAVAAGAFVAYLDDDNFWCPDFIEVMVEALEASPNSLIAYCNSVNYYSPDEKQRVIARDKRTLASEGADWTVFTSAANGLGLYGIDRYVDANEIVHRKEVLLGLEDGWAIEHPCRKSIMSAQGWIRPQRRFNDLEFVERIINTFGEGCLLHVDAVKVHFFYPSFSSSRDGLCRWPFLCGRSVREAESA